MAVCRAFSAAASARSAAAGTGEGAHSKDSGLVWCGWNLRDLSNRSDDPVTSEHLEVDGVPGLFLAGEVTGHAIVRTAITHGTTVAARVAERAAQLVAAEPTAATSPTTGTKTNPNHATSGFSRRCQPCHNTTSRQGAQLNHGFPRTGNHNVSRATCHTTPGNFKFFNCLSCHAHNQTKMDDEHTRKAGYSYASTACHRCDPNTE